MQANHRLLDLLEFAVRLRSLTELFDDFFLLTMGIEQRELEPFEIRAALSRSSSPAQPLQNLLGPQVPLKRITTHVELSCHESESNILRAACKVFDLIN